MFHTNYADYFIIAMNLPPHTNVMGEKKRHLAAFCETKYAVKSRHYVHLYWLACTGIGGLLAGMACMPWPANNLLFPLCKETPLSSFFRLVVYIPTWQPSGCQVVSAILFYTSIIKFCRAVIFIPSGAAAFFFFFFLAQSFHCCLNSSKYSQVSL